MKSIHNIAMLINLNIAYWTANASDDQVIEDVARRTKSEIDQHQYKKILVKPEAINEVKAVRSRARAYHFAKTMPWVDGGTRILPSVFYKEYSEKMHEFRSEYEAAVAKFCRQYSALKGEARKRLGSVFKDEDYPSEAAIRSKFSWDMKPFSIPMSSDWRVEGLSAKENSDIKKQIDDAVGAALENAAKDLVGRLMKVVKNLSTTMKEAKPTFRDSIIGNIKEMIEQVREMNVVGNTKVEAIVKEVEATLSKVNPEELREDKKKRKAVADDADAILKKMAGYLGS